MKRLALSLLLLFAFIFIQCEPASNMPSEDILETSDELSDDDGMESGEDENNDSSDENDESVDEDSNDTSGEDENNDDSDDSDGQDSHESCDNEDIIFVEEEEDSEATSECAQQLNEGTVACITNGEAFISSGIFSGGAYEEVDGAFVFGIIAGDGVDETTDITQIDQRGLAVLVSSVNLGLDDIEENVEYRGANGENLLSGGFEVIASYVKIEGCETSEIGFDISPTAIIEFSQIDRQNQIISGTFSFMAFDEQSNNTYPIMEGTFENLWYCNQGTIEGKSRIFGSRLKRLINL